MKYYSPKEILDQRETVPLIDVRTPAEFEAGHIPGAVNMPLFSDEERVVVGTLYVRQGKDEAVEKGLEYVGPKMAGFVKEAKKLIPADRRINLYCWRGGMRSGSMAWLLETAGLDVGLLRGGYKTYRSFIREDFAREVPVIVLGGMTGSGKTEILHRLALQGEQVLDLEGLANHRGSTFGALGEPQQPTNEMFENNTWEVWGNFRSDRSVWVEDESMAIGSVWVNPVLYNRIATGTTLNLVVPFEERVQRLMKEYGAFDSDVLQQLIRRIGRRVGGDQARMACEALDKGDLCCAVKIVLRYYDKAYEHGLEGKKRVFDIVSTTGDAIENTDMVIQEASREGIVSTVAGKDVEGDF